MGVSGVWKYPKWELDEGGDDGVAELLGSWRHHASSVSSITDGIDFHKHRLSPGPGRQTERVTGVATACAAAEQPRIQRRNRAQAKPVNTPVSRHCQAWGTPHEMTATTTSYPPITHPAKNKVRRNSKGCGWSTQPCAQDQEPWLAARRPRWTLEEAQDGEAPGPQRSQALADHPPPEPGEGPDDVACSGCCDAITLGS